MKDLELALGDSVSSGLMRSLRLCIRPEKRVDLAAIIENFEQ
ncbi:hypothetical protein PK69_08990 [Xanthomonas phaseoli pv. phaseoli]|uniref:Uncharacterized protein n=1 Tax=Xanthomonas campestris pv. phaseoli TaxID=317013 RepID=A0AB34QME3_XANCH|nr:hypothetical protein AC609_08995 [Xanthomonas phaseoli pv. phaseoli]AZU32522.1 hypothetical protein AC801_23050 [Xanthomonas sp. ISO98C4]AZU25604.1 hypothetical protein AC611_09000 [Xanthomonas phaseoli pv. phaseoli]AZU34372.1 hypothetical protein AC610_08990 [Xanthomonas phaseoli pv. phaseoli]KGT49532.1 hypothetical protein NZ02_19360 [Xanthomonas phaseoli pv. phaseoli]